MPSSTRSPSAAQKEQWTALLGSGRSPITAFAIAGTFGPLTRTTPMPPRPAAVATAAMVSGATGIFPARSFPISPLGMGRFVAIEHALDLPLLKDGKDVVYEPGQNQSGGKE